MKSLKRAPAEHLIIAADFKTLSGQGLDSVRSQVLYLADQLEGTGTYLKVNSALRACGYGLIHEIRARGLKVFADLKLYDIGKTLSTDGLLLREMKPELLTVACAADEEAIQALKRQLVDTEVLGVTVLTDFDEDGCLDVFGFNIGGTVENQARRGLRAGVDGFTASAKEIPILRKVLSNPRIEKTIVTPGIRFDDGHIRGDDQNPDRIATPSEAILAGATRIVMGRPITLAKNPRKAAERAIEEISEALERMPSYTC